MEDPARAHSAGAILFWEIDPAFKLTMDEKSLNRKEGWRVLPDGSYPPPPLYLLLSPMAIWRYPYDITETVSSVEGLFPDREMR